MPAISKIRIVNRALTKIGSDRISSFTDGSKAGTIAAEIYDDLRDEVLEAHPWNFAEKNAALNALDDSANPDLEFGHAFQLPSDCIRPIKTDLALTEDWKIRKDLLVTNATAVTLKYTFRQTDEGMFSRHFIEALSCRLAVELNYSMTGKADLTASLLQLYERAIASARSFDAQGGGKPDRMTASTWTRSRL